MGCPICLLMCYLLVTGHFQDSHQLTFKQVSIPSSVKVGEDYVILDCDYDLQNTSKRALVVKWYYDNYDVVYQWIHGKRPQVADSHAKYVDLAYKASDDPDTMYRAMKLVKPDIELTGDYKCLISTLEKEIDAERRMTVYSTGREEEFKLWYGKSMDGDDLMEVTCQAVGLYPEPVLDITVEDYPTRPSKPVMTVTEDGYFNAISYLILNETELPNSVVINCELQIPSVNYNATKKIVHYSSGKTSTTSATAITINATTNLLRKLEIEAFDRSRADSSSGVENSCGYKSIDLLLLAVNFLTFFALGR